MPSCSMPLTSFDLLDLQRRQISRSFSVKALIRMSPRGVQKSTFCWGVELGWGSRDEGYYVSWKSHNLDFWWFYSHMVLGSKGILGVHDPVVMLSHPKIVGEQTSGEKKLAIEKTGKFNVNGSLVVK